MSFRTPLEKSPSRRFDTTPLRVISHISIGFQPRVSYGELAAEVDMPAQIRIQSESSPLSMIIGVKNDEHVFDQHENGCCPDNEAKDSE